MSQYTPMIKQYLQIKDQHKDCILFFRLGDFYEMFFEDAKTASRELDIVLTGRDGGCSERIPMCGVPYHSANNYIAKLIQNGYKVAICEQTEDPAKAVGIVKREVIRIITPGTVMDNDMLDEGSNNFLAAIIQYKKDIGFAYTDISTGIFRVTEFSGKNSEERLISEILRIQPAELLIVKPSSIAELLEFRIDLRNILLNEIVPENFSLKRSEEVLKTQLALPSLEALGIQDNIAAIQAAAAIISFLQENQKSELKHLKSLQVYSDNHYMGLDPYSRRNLELTSSLREGKKEGSLLGILDKCKTPMGKRALRNFIEQPLTNLDLIEKRLDAVEELVNNIALRNGISEILKHVYDLERLAGKLGSGLATPRDLIAIKKTLSVLPDLVSLCAEGQSELIWDFSQMDVMSEVYQMINAAIVEDAPLNIKEGGIIKTGFDEKIDELKSLSTEGNNYLLELERNEKEKTGIKYLKIGFNKIFGYYIEVSKSNVNLVPDYYIRKQTLVNTERYITPELKEYEQKILGAREKLFELEYQCFINLRTQLEKYITTMQETAALIGELDVFSDLAGIAYDFDYCRPQLCSDEVLEIKAGRHPVVENYLNSGRFVPNDLRLDKSKHRLAIITGPNMGGKSTYMRQAALIVIMAQMGSFVPAASAKIGLVDRVFTRVGAADDLSAGQSTFMVEMLELANIINNATAKSFIILDEIGRGTSTYDGLSIARAVSEYIHKYIKARTLFATHYHELTELAHEYEGIFNLSVSVREDGEKVTFLKKVLPGKADKSYGIHVASLSGLPKILIDRAKDILTGLETDKSNIAKPVIIQSSLFQDDDVIKQKLSQLDLDNLTPREALNILYEWKNEID